MKNTITASIEFYFKGEKFTPSITIQVDDYMQSTFCLPDLHTLIATKNNIDLYSYEYEIMLTEPVHIEHAEGLIAEYVIDGQLNKKVFEQAWQEHQTFKQLQNIAQQHMTIDNLQNHPELQKALQDAFQLGQRSPAKN